MDYTKLLTLNLQLASDGGAGGAEGGAEGAAAQSSSTHPQVVYGKALETGAKPDAGNTGDDLQAEFDELINGKYKDIYGKKVQSTIQSRLKGTQDKVAGYDAVQPLLAMIGDRYGIQAKDGQYDLDAIRKAVEEDSSYLEEEAMKEGVSVERLRQIKKLERDNEALRVQMQESRQRDQANKLYAQWLDQAAKVKEVYPNFNVQQELQNPDFVRLLQSGISMDAAFKVIHYDDMLKGGMEYAVKQTKKQVAENIRANGNRPAENGSSGAAAVVYKSDVSKLSDKDFDEINRQVMAGKRISFG